jgi:UDP-GlcNAc:undecaprenyl-phosphate/decaprenyl-phosphate GlcNAc-1-phosphate transferase
VDDVTISLISIVAITAVVTGLAEIPVVRWLQAASVHSIPDHRTSHDAPTPRGGGIVLIVAFVVFTPIAGKLFGTTSQSMLPVMFGVGAFGVLGFLDDVRTLKASTRLATQVVLATGMAYWISETLQRLFTYQLLFVALTAGWIIFFVNAFNFMDGINGISIAQTISSGVCMMLLEHSGKAKVGVFGATLVGGSLGFAPFNFRNRGRAKVFLGDCGSYGLGAAIASLLLIAANGTRGRLNVLVFGTVMLYCLDVTITLFRRFYRKERLLEAHREHLYQILTENKISHTQLSFAVLVVGLIMAGAPFIAT